MNKERLYEWADGKKLVLTEDTLVMGILNGTPDSFSDGGQYNTVKTATQHVQQLVNDGAHIIDVGVESTRPGHTQITVEEELRRMQELLPTIMRTSTVPVSIDTYRARSAEYALSLGAHILNDIWGLQYDDEIAAVVAAYNVPVVIMHNQNHTQYHDIIDDMKAFFYTSLERASQANIHSYNIWLDPGIGFGKTGAQNIEVMKRLHEITALDYPVLLGTSRKRFIGELLNGLPATERDEGTTATCIVGALHGVNVVRVHNVQMVSRALQVANAIK